MLFYFILFTTSPDFCDRFINMYYTQGILLKPEYHIMPEIKIIKRWMNHLKTQKKKATTPKAGSSNRKLAADSEKQKEPTQIIPAAGIDQIWTKYWTLKYIPRFDKEEPKVSLTSYYEKSKLEKISFKTEPRLRASSKYIQPKAPWEKQAKNANKKD